MGNVVSARESKNFNGFCNFVLSHPFVYLITQDGARATEDSIPTKGSRKGQKNWRKQEGRTRRRRLRPPSLGSVLCVSLKCQTQKPTSSILKASIQKHRCPTN